MESLYTFFVLATAVGALSITLTKASIFKSVREWIKTRNTWFGDLVSCPYCMSHWLVFASVSYYQVYLVTSSFLFIDWLVTVFAMVAVSNFIGGIVYRAYKNLPFEVSTEVLGDLTLKKEENAS